jgi:hypothetical protein
MSDEGELLQSVNYTGFQIIGRDSRVTIELYQLPRVLIGRERCMTTVAPLYV